MTPQTKEIIWNIINSLLAGILVLLGAFTTGHISGESFCAAAIAAGIVAVTQFKNYWDGEKGEFSSKMFSFVSF